MIVLWLSLLDWSIVIGNVSTRSLISLLAHGDQRSSQKRAMICLEDGLSREVVMKLVLERLLLRADRSFMVLSRVFFRAELIGT